MSRAAGVIDRVIIVYSIREYGGEARGLELARIDHRAHHKLAQPSPQQLNGEADRSIAASFSLARSISSQSGNESAVRYSNSVVA